MQISLDQHHRAWFLLPARLVFKTTRQDLEAPACCRVETKTGEMNDLCQRLSWKQWAHVTWGFTNFTSNVSGVQHFCFYLFGYGKETKSRWSQNCRQHFLICKKQGFLYNPPPHPQKVNFFLAANEVVHDLKRLYQSERIWKTQSETTGGQSV